MLCSKLRRSYEKPLVWINPALQSQKLYSQGNKKIEFKIGEDTFKNSSNKKINGNIIPVQNTAEGTGKNTRYLFLLAGIPILSGYVMLEIEEHFSASDSEEELDMKIDVLLQKENSEAIIKLLILLDGNFFEKLTGNDCSRIENQILSKIYEGDSLALRDVIAAHNNGY
jgi:hypothetical protein